MKRQSVTVLGSSTEGKPNIGNGIVNELLKSGWDVTSSDCWEGWGYDVPEEIDTDALVVSLGVCTIAPLHEQGEEEIQRVLRACLTLPLLAARNYLDTRQAKGGKVVFIGSYNHDHPLSNGTPYSAAKAGLAMAVRSLAWDYTEQGYSFAIVHPSVVPGTQLSDDAVQGSAETLGTDPASVAQSVSEAVLVAEGALTPKHVGMAVAGLLASPVSAWLSGTGINLYGGQR